MATEGRDGPLAAPRSSGASDASSRGSEVELPQELTLAFRPLHKRALGMAVGAAAAVLVAGLTIFHLLVSPQPGVDLSLLGQYFTGYTVTWGGVLIGSFWAFVSGFVVGWFAAFCRNFVLALLLFVGRTRAELAATRDFLDHI